MQTVCCRLYDLPVSLELSAEEVGVVAVALVWTLLAIRERSVGGWKEPLIDLEQVRR